MQNPFVFGKAAEGVHFTDRKQDALRLSANLSHGINTVLISPRRWGKTSLVKKVIEDVSSDEIKVVFIDIFSLQVSIRLPAHLCHGSHQADFF